jgi:hypothetical protein
MLCSQSSRRSAMAGNRAISRKIAPLFQFFSRVRILNRARSDLSEPDPNCGPGTLCVGAILYAAVASLLAGRISFISGIDIQCVSRPLCAIRSP